MNKIRKIMPITFTIVARLWVIILLKTFLINISCLNKGSIAIIGGADMPTYQLIFSRSLPLLFWLISIIAFTILNIISTYKISNSKCLNILVVISFIAMISGIILTAPRYYSSSLYATFSRFTVTNTQLMVWGFYSISFIITVLTGLLLLPLKREEVL